MALILPPPTPAEKQFCRHGLRQCEPVLVRERPIMAQPCAERSETTSAAEWTDLLTTPSLSSL
jgi:hypothetical protein